MTCQKTNTLYHHHHHGECLSLQKQFSLSCFYLLTLFTFTLFTHPVAFISLLSLSLSLSLSALKRFSYLSILSVFLLFLHSLPSLFSPILFGYHFICLPYRHSSPLILETANDTCSSVFVDVLVTALQSNLQFFPEDDRNWQLLMCSSPIFCIVLLQLVSVLLLVLVLLLKQHLALSST